MFGSRGRDRSSGSAAPLRVTLFSLNFWPETTGIGPYARDLATGLSARGYDVRVVTAYPHYPQWMVPSGYRGLRMTDAVDGVAVTRLRHYVPRNPTPIRRAISELIFGVRTAFTSWHAPDVALFMSPALISSALAVATRGARRQAAVGVVVQDLYSTGVRELGGAAGAQARIIDLTEAALLRRADGVATIHQRLRGQLALMVVDPGKIRVIRNWAKAAPAADRSDREARRTAFGWDADDVIVLHSGAMGVKQGLENVIAAARLSQGSAPSVKFVLLGDGSRRRDLEASARGLSTVAFMDPLPEDAFQDALRCADVLLINELPDLEQTALPSKLTSYLATGSPVLAAVRPGGLTAGEVLASGGGICVPAGEPEQLLRAVLRMSSDPAASAELGARGLEYCSKVLSKESALNSYAEWVQELSDRHKGEQ